MPAIGLDKVRAVLKARSVTGNFRCQLAIQTADARTDVPGDWVRAKESADEYLTGAGEKAVDVSMIWKTSSTFFARFGVLYNYTGSPAVTEADLSLQLAFDACGSVVDSRTQVIQTPDATNVQYTPVSGWIPAIHADKVKAAFLLSGVQGTVTYRLAYQTAATSQQVTNAWTLLEGGPSSALERCLADTTLSLPTTDMWVRFAVAHILASGSNGGATLSTAIAVRRT